METIPTNSFLKANN